MGARMYADRCAGARQGCALRAHPPARREGRIRGSEQWIWVGGRGEQHWGPLGFCFYLRKRGGPFFFLLGLDPPFFRGRGGRSGASGALQGSGPFPALGGAGRARELAVRPWPHSVGAPDASGMPFPPRRAGSPRARRPDTPARAGKAHGSPTCCSRRARPGTRAPCLGPARPRPGTPGSRPRGGEGGRPCPSRLSSSHSSRTGFCAALGGGRVRLLAARADSRFSSASLHFDSSLDRLPFLLPSGSREKLLPRVCRRRLQVSAGLAGNPGCVRARSGPGAGGKRRVSPPRPDRRSQGRVPTSRGQG